MISDGILVGRTVVVSPHLDDAVFSLGATIAQTTGSGERVEVLTVLAGDPSSKARAGTWDTRAGFRTEGEATRARRAEDERACAVLEATPVWLPYGDSQYKRHGTQHEIRDAIYSSVAGSDNVLVPGFPFRHGDHSWVTETVLGGELPCRRVALYLEQPYTLKRPDVAGSLVASGPLESLIGLVEPFRPVVVGEAALRAKSKAIGAYASQLAIMSTKELPRKLVEEPEALAWLAAGYRKATG